MDDTKRERNGMNRILGEVPARRVIWVLFTALICVLLWVASAFADRLTDLEECNHSTHDVLIRIESDVDWIKKHIGE